PPQHLYDRRGNSIVDYRLKLLEFSEFISTHKKANIPIELYIYKLGPNPDNLNVPCRNVQASDEELPYGGLTIDLHHKDRNGFSLFAFEQRGGKQIRFRLGVVAVTPIEPEIYTDSFRE
ncbi:MAG: hypothetical protein KGH71_03545, partial [Candidatus Micrarchaeota archaeon]|nr:hypothetical protein [Candidatus Micrarchaeota archaeon]